MATMTIPQNITVKDLHKITESTVFVTVRFGLMGNSKKVRAESGDVSGANTIGVNTDANLNLLRVQKTLLESKELEAIKTADGRLKTYLETVWLPYDMGIKLLPVGLLPTVEQRLQAYKLERQNLIEVFVSAYYDLCLTAKARLGSLYNPLDYPSSESIRSRFRFDWQYVSLAIPEHLKGISADLYKAEAIKAEAKFADAANDIFILMREDLLDKVTHLSQRLEPSPDGKVKKLHSTAVSALQDFLSTFQFRNIVDDKQLDAVCAKLKTLVAGVSADGLRDNDTAKAALQAKLETVKGQLTKLVETVPGRKIRKD
jgi:hypothetical protein